MSTRHLDHLLTPRSVAVIGATDRVGSIGATVWRHLRAGGFAGPVYAVNLRLKELDGEPVVAHAAQLPAPPDLAVLCTPPASIAGLIDTLGRLGTRAAIVMTPGLSAAQKRALCKAARPNLLRVLGPDCFGLLSPHLALNASLAPGDAPAGSVALVSQPGALVAAVLDGARSRRIGFSHLVSLGEQVDVDAGDLLDHLAGDARTRAILLCIASIQSPRKFMSAARAAARNKPVIVVNTAAAFPRAAQAGTDRAFDAAIRRAGMLQVDTLADLLFAAETLAHADTAVADNVTSEAAQRAAALLGTYRCNQALLLEAPAASENPVPDVAGARVIVAAALAAGRELLDDGEARQLLLAYGIPTAGGVDATAHGDAAAAARLQAQASTLRIGACIDPLFGPLLLFGEGGAAVHGVADSAVALPPLNRALARDMVSRTRVGRLLAGGEGLAAVDHDAVGDVLIAVSQMLVDLPELCEFEINPLWADAAGVTAPGAQVRISATRPAGAAHFAIAPYPAELAHPIDWNGETLLLRPIRPEDEAMHRAFIDGLAPQDLRLRFFSGRRDLPRSELARLTQIDYAREMAFIAVRTAADGTAQTLGVVRAVSDPDNVEAEFAIIVRSDLHGAGLGRLLLGEMIAYLRHAGVRTLVGDVLHHNTAMRGLALASGFEIDEARCDADSLCLVLALAPPAAR